MGKEDIKEYFSHDCGARNDPDMVPLLEDFKGRGYGIFWATIELMHQRKGSLPYNENTFKAIGLPLGEKVELVKKIIEKCVDTYKLFFVENGELANNRVLKNLSKRKKSILQRVNAGKASATKRQRPLNDRSTTDEQRKGKERKGNRDQGVPVPVQEINPKTVKAPKEQEVVESFVRMGGTAEQATKFFDKYEAIGWKIKGNPIIQWTSLIRSFMETWDQIRKENSGLDENGKPKMIYA